jgi:hypothetical protein
VRSGNDYVPDKKALPVEISLVNGTLLKGKVWAPAVKSVADILNGPQSFLEFTPYTDERAHYLAKAHIATLVVVEIPKAVPLYERRGVLDADDPHHILGLAPGAAWHEVREAYLQLAKAYHPDRFAAASLPGEVTEYLGIKARRINAAYAALEDSLKRAV